MSWRTSGDHPNYNNVENGQKKTIKGTGVLVSWRTSGDHPNCSNVENGKNTEKSFGDFRRLSVTQTPVKDHQLILKE